MKAIWRGRVIAESDRTLDVGGYTYFPREAVRMDLLLATPKTQGATVDNPLGVAPGEEPITQVQLDEKGNIVTAEDSPTPADAGAPVIASTEDTGSSGPENSVPVSRIKSGAESMKPVPPSGSSVNRESLLPVPE